MGFGETEFLAYDIRAGDQADDLVVSVAPAHAFTAHAAIGRDHEPFGRNMLKRRANSRGDLIGCLDL